MVEQIWLQRTVVAVLFVALVVLMVLAKRTQRKNWGPLPGLADHIREGRRFHVYLAQGEVLRNVRFVDCGFDTPAAPLSLFLDPAQHGWIVAEREDGGRVRIRPSAVASFEDAG